MDKSDQSEYPSGSDHHTISIPRTESIRNNLRPRRNPNFSRSYINHVSSSVSMSFMRKHKRRATLADMIDQILFENHSRKRAISFRAVQNILADKYQVNVKLLKTKIRKYINESLACGRFIQKSGRGANGSFRLAPIIRNRLHNQRRVFHQKSMVGLLNRQTRSLVTV